MRSHLKKSSLPNQNGYVTILILALMAIAGIVGSSIIDQQLLTNRLLNKGRVDARVFYLRQQLMAAVYNNAAWTEQTALDNTCLLTGENCNLIDQAQDLILKDQRGTVLNDSVDPAFGYDLQGVPCRNFDSVNGNPTCPFRFHLTWTANQCKAGKCLINVHASFIHKPGTANTNNGIIMNPSRYAFDLLRGTESGSLQEACSSMNGIFQQGTNTCTVNVSSSNTCPPGQFLIKGKNTGQIICQPSLGSASVCPDGSAAIGFGENGRLNCKSVLDWIDEGVVK